jgi:hypothetical protein
MWIGAGIDRKSTSGILSRCLNSGIVLLSDKDPKALARRIRRDEEKSE